MDPMQASGRRPEDRCTRCNGSGRYASERAHHGIPGLCLDCDGDGSAATQRRNRTAVRECRDEAARYAENRRRSAAPVLAIRERSGAGRAIPRERRDRFPVETVFTTAAYAEANGQSEGQAFRELALGYPGIDIAFDREGQAVGWQRTF